MNTNRITKLATMGLNLGMRPLRKNSGEVLGLPSHLQIEITNRCNLLCKSCHRDLLYPKTTTMSFETFKRVFDEVRPTNVNVSGIGEPFLNKDAIRMIEYAKQGGASVNCATNLTVVEKMIDKIVDSGIDQLKVSIDGATRETYHEIRKKDLFDKLLSNVQAINAAKQARGQSTPNIRYNFALQSSNFDEVLDMIDLAVKSEVKVVYIQYLAYYGGEERKRDLVKGFTKENVLDLLVRAETKAKAHGITTNIANWMLQFDKYWEQMDVEAEFQPDKTHCYFPWFTSWIDADGTVRPCPVIPWVRDVAHMGNVNETSFTEIWNNDKYREFRRAHARGCRPNEVCQKCVPSDLKTILNIGTKLLPK